MYTDTRTRSRTPNKQTISISTECGRGGGGVGGRHIKPSKQDKIAQYVRFDLTMWRYSCFVFRFFSVGLFLQPKLH